MKEKTFEKVTEYIDAIAAKLGVAAEHVYGLMVKQQVAEGVSFLVVSFIVLTASVIAISKVLKKGFEYEIKQSVYGNDRREWAETPSNIVKFIVLLVAGIALFASGMGLAINGSESVMQIINPEYYAIKEILEALGGGN